MEGAQSWSACGAMGKRGATFSNSTAESVTPKNPFWTRRAVPRISLQVGARRVHQRGRHGRVHRVDNDNQRENNSQASRDSMHCIRPRLKRLHLAIL
ncbi:unnamed protein product [Peniophora sp. CBMAI 1063]|nr:unnamed protein product [Peniophora sp. CBMAI 1063]